MKIVKPLTDTMIKGFKPAEKAYKKADGHGLYLEVLTDGTKRWWARYKFEGAPSQKALGKYPEVGLKDAREACHDVMKQVREGVNPSRRAAKRAAEGVRTFGKVALEWEAQFLVEPRLCARTIAGKKRFLRKHILPAIGERPILEVEPPVLLNEVLRPIQGAGHLDLAHRVRAMCGEIFRFAVANGWAVRDPSHDLHGAMPNVVHKHRATIIKPEQIGRLLLNIEHYQGFAIVRHAMMLAPLVFLRPGELRQLEWAWVNWEKKEIRLPAAVMKMRMDHIVPLSRQALEVLKSMREISGRGRFVFPGQRMNGKPMSDNGVNTALKIMGYSAEEITAHGFRAMATTLLNERGYNRDHIERQLAHSERDAVRDAYNYAQYLPQRAQMMQEWADYLDELKEAARLQMAS